MIACLFTIWNRSCFVSFRWMIVRILIVLLSVMSYLPSPGQRAEVDSMSAELDLMPDDERKVDLLLEMARLSFNFAIPRSRAYAETALQLAKENQYLPGEVLAGYRMSLVYNSEGKLDSAYALIQYVNENAISNGDSNLYCRGLIVAGTVLGKLDNDSLAMECFYEALEMGEVLGNLLVIADAANGLATINTGLGYYDRSRSFLTRSLAVAEQLDDPKLIVKYCVNLAILHDSTSERQFYAEKALKIASSHPNMNRELTYAYNTMGLLHYYNLDDVDSSLHYKKMALDRAIASNEPMLIQMISSSIAEVYRTSSLDSAAKYYQQLLQDTAVQTYGHHQESNLRKLSEIKYLQGDSDAAYELLDSSYMLVKERHRQSLDDAVADANAKYETEKKESELARQALLIAEQKNDRNRILIFGGFLLAGLTLLGQFTISRQKRKRKETELALYVEKQRATDLENLAQAKTDLFNNVSHELRTPLTMIIGPLEQAIVDIKNVSLKQKIELALSNSRRITSLVNEILDLSKLDAGKMNIDISQINLLGFLNRVFYTFSSLAVSQQITLEDNLDTGKLQDISIKTDISKLEKIINNLVSNAIKYSGPGDSVTLLLDYEALSGNILRLSIIDQGVGISVVDQSRVFDRYYQVTGQSHSSGTGIGLALTKELVELLEGNISVNSDGKSGTSFCVEIPMPVISQQQRPAAGPQPQMHRSDIVLESQQGSRQQMLIVEDDLPMGKYIKGILGQFLDCEVAYNGRQALELLNHKNFDLISADIMMPEMEGFEFRRRINQNPLLKNTPFIMLTARALEEDKLRGFQLGVDDYLTKPFSPDELVARVKNLLKNKRSRNQVVEENISFEEDFIDRARSTTKKNLDNPDFNVVQLANELNYSTRQLARILKKSTGLTPVEFILELRLLHAYQIVQDRKFSTLSEVQYEVGIESASYFSKKFKERFGLNPSQLAKSVSA